MSRQGFPDLRVQTCECRCPVDVLQCICGQAHRSLTIAWKGSRSPMETAESLEQFSAVNTVSESDCDILRRN